MSQGKVYDQYDGVWTVDQFFQGIDLHPTIKGLPNSSLSRSPKSF